MPCEDYQLPDADQLQNALSKLEHRTRDLVVAYIRGNMTFRGISSAFDLSRAKAQRIYQHAIRLLQQMIHIEQDA